MSNYRRSKTAGACYFFTVVTYRRQPIFADTSTHIHLRQAINKARINYPFEINAWVLLPDHLHCIWTLPENDADFSVRWSIIKAQFSKRMRSQHREHWLTPSKLKYRESTIWQRRFWEHQIRDERDYRHHLDYIHYNPVKHGLVNHPREWPYSTYHHHVKTGTYPPDWSAATTQTQRSFGE